MLIDLTKDIDRVVLDGEKSELTIDDDIEMRNVQNADFLHLFCEVRYSLVVRNITCKNLKITINNSLNLTIENCKCTSIEIKPYKSLISRNTIWKFINVIGDEFIAENAFKDLPDSSIVFENCFFKFANFNEAFGCESLSRITIRAKNSTFKTVENKLMLRTDGFVDIFDKETLSTFHILSSEDLIKSIFTDLEINRIAFLDSQMRLVKIVVESEISTIDFKEIASELNAKIIGKSKLVISQCPSTRTVFINSYESSIKFINAYEPSSKGVVIPLTRTSSKYYASSFQNSNSTNDVASSPKFPFYHILKLMNVDLETENNIFEVLNGFGIFKYHDYYPENPFRICEVVKTIFNYPSRGTIDDDLKQELRYHHGDGSLYNFEVTTRHELEEVKREFINWLDGETTNAWYYDKNWNHVSYLAITKFSLESVRNENSKSIFSDEILENVKKNGACIVAAMICGKTGIRDSYEREYIRIEDVTTRVRSKKLSLLLYYNYIARELESKNSIQLIPGKISENGVRYWAKFLFDDFENNSELAEWVLDETNELEWLGLNGLSDSWRELTNYLSHEEKS